MKQRSPPPSLAEEEAPLLPPLHPVLRPLAGFGNGVLHDARRARRRASLVLEHIAKVVAPEQQEAMSARGSFLFLSNLITGASQRRWNPPAGAHCPRQGRACWLSLSPSCTVAQR